MSKLSQPMIDALVGSEKDEFGYRLGEIKRQTYTALEGRGLVQGRGPTQGGWLTPEGVQARSEHVSTPEHPDAQLNSLADWERDLLGDEIPISQVLAKVEASVSQDEAELIIPNGANITPEMIDQAAQNLLKAVDLDRPHVVPNREDKRKQKFSVRGAWQRLQERKRVRAHLKYGDPIHRKGDVNKSNAA